MNFLAKIDIFSYSNRSRNSKTRFSTIELICCKIAKKSGNEEMRDRKKQPKLKQHLLNFCFISANFYFFCMKVFSGESTLSKLSNALSTMFLWRLENVLGTIESSSNPKWHLKPRFLVNTILSTFCLILSLKHFLFNSFT